MASRGRGTYEMAIPLCLPNNCTWDSRNGTYTTTNEERTSLHVIPEALEKLQAIKGPVCVVSVAGPYRKGKSWILSEAFDQPEVFPLGHTMDPETMGIWLWIVPEKIKDSNGKECTVVLLDSEGIDAVKGEGFNDSQIFTLTVLLASVLIYNSQGVPTRNDLDGLKFIVKLSQRIQLRSDNGSKGARNRHQDTEYFHKTFPFFIWLLRDVTQSLPSDCRDIQEYFLTRVFKEQGLPATDQNQQVAESILRFFPGFRAFKLPSPTTDENVLKDINSNKREVNPKFLSGVEDFKRLVSSTLVAKQSFNDGEIVTGEGLAALIQLYVDATNTPGVVPNIQSAWEIFVDHKCSEALGTALQSYEAFMNAQISGQLPCDNDIIRQVHNNALEPSINQIEADTFGISSITIDKYLKTLTESADKTLSWWIRENETKTKDSCSGLLGMLKKEHLDPVLARLLGADGSKVSFESIVQAYTRLEDDYQKLAKGAKDVCATVFFEFHPELMKEMQQYTGILRQLKDFDENLAREVAAKAYQEQEKKKLEEEHARLQQQDLERKKEFQLLSEKQEEERKRLSQQFEAERKAHQEQMDNMLKASMKKAEQDRNAFIRENQALQQRIQEMHETNERIQRDIEILQGQLEENTGRQAEVQKPGFFDKALQFVSGVVPILGTIAKVAPKCSVM